MNLNTTSIFSNIYFRIEFYEHDNHAFSFSQIYIGVEKNIFYDYLQINFMSNIYPAQRSEPLTQRGQ